MRRLRQAVFGPPLSSEVEVHERLDKRRALAVFASDALSSTAYATEEILLILVLAGTGHIDLALPIAGAITLLLTAVILSYRETVRAYPGGGGAYSVASDNLGPWAGLLGAAALLADYVLTVAVSISAGSLAVIAALPELSPYRLEIALVALLVVMFVNLRGVRESGTAFAVPTYLFIGVFSLLILTGLTRLAFGNLEPSTSAAAVEGTSQALGVFLILRAFSSGATALTGVEAIANGVTAFRAPESRNAATTMAWMGGILAAFFLGATFLVTQLQLVPVEGDSVVSQLARVVFDGYAPLYYLVQAATALILVLAANTAFNDFPRLAAILARDGYMPRRFAARGDRLTFSLGIVSLAAVAGIVLVGFRADTHRLIPLYAIGVFLAFTLSQTGMVIRWRRLGRGGWPIWVNGTGAVATGIVAVVVAVTKFSQGAWAVAILVPLLVMILWYIHVHYRTVAQRLALPDRPRLSPRPASLAAQPMLVPVRELNRVTWNAVEYARQLSRDVIGVHVVREHDGAEEDLATRWEQILPDVPLVLIESPYRTFLGPFLAYADSIGTRVGGTVTVVVPEFRPDHWWERFLHNRTGRLIEDAGEDYPRLAVTALTVRLPRERST